MMFDFHCFNAAAFNEILSGGGETIVATGLENAGAKLAADGNRVRVFANPETSAQKISLGGSMTEVATAVETQNLKAAQGANIAAMRFKTFWQNPVFIPSGFGAVFGEAVFNPEPDDNVKFSHKIFNLRSEAVVLTLAGGTGTKCTAGSASAEVFIIAIADWGKYTGGESETIILLVPEGSGYWYRRLYAVLSVLERQITLEVE
jgi:hypothetical protein